MPSLRALGLCATLTLAPVACGPSYVAADADGSDDGDGDEGGGSGGAASGGAASGGSTACNVDADCALAADFRDACFSPDCSHPIAVTKVTLAAETCLLPWAERWDTGIPETCAAHDQGDDCPAICALPLDCPEAGCDDGACSVQSDPLAACEE